MDRARRGHFENGRNFEIGDDPNELEPQTCVLTLPSRSPETPLLDPDSTYRAQISTVVLRRLQATIPAVLN